MYNLFNGDDEWVPYCIYYGNNNFLCGYGSNTAGKAYVPIIAMGNFKDFLTLKFLSAAFITGLAIKRQKEKFSKTSLLSYNFVLLSIFVILKFTSDTYTN